jgi:hypothetical protein
MDSIATLIFSRANTRFSAVSDPAGGCFISDDFQRPLDYKDIACLFRFYISLKRTLCRYYLKGFKRLFLDPIMKGDNP